MDPTSQSPNTELFNFDDHMQFADELLGIETKKQIEQTRPEPTTNLGRAYRNHLSRERAQAQMTAEGRREKAAQGLLDLAGKPGHRSLKTLQRRISKPKESLETHGQRVDMLRQGIPLIEVERTLAYGSREERRQRLHGSRTTEAKTKSQEPTPDRRSNVAQSSTSKVEAG